VTFCARSMAAELDALRVLLPRPHRDEDSFADQLAAMGCQVARLPVLRIVPLLRDARERAAFCAELSRHRHIVFVSINAVQIARDLLAHSDRDFAPDARFYAVGSATAQALGDLGLPVIYPQRDATTEGLLREPQLAQVSGEEFLICRGRDGRNVLRDTLAKRGATVVCRDIYAREPSAACRDEIRRLLGERRIDIVAIHSGAVFAALWQLLDDEGRSLLRELPLVVPGERVANLLRAEGCRDLVIADSALTDDMTEGLIRWYTRRGRRSAT